MPVPHPLFISLAHITPNSDINLLIPCWNICYLSPTKIRSKTRMCVELYDVLRTTNTESET